MEVSRLRFSSLLQVTTMDIKAEPRRAAMARYSAMTALPISSSDWKSVKTKTESKVSREVANVPKMAVRIARRRGW